MDWEKVLWWSVSTLLKKDLWGSANVGNIALMPS